MKKLKFMLLTLALVAVVAGALAFKAKRIDSFCTAAIPSGGVCNPSGGLSCPNLISGSTYVGGSGTSFCTAAPVSGSCTGVNCVATTRSFALDH